MNILLAIFYSFFSNNKHSLGIYYSSIKFYLQKLNFCFVERRGKFITYKREALHKLSFTGNPVWVRPSCRGRIEEHLLRTRTGRSQSLLHYLESYRKLKANKDKVDGRLHKSPLRLSTNSESYNQFSSLFLI